MEVVVALGSLVGSNNTDVPETLDIELVLLLAGPDGLLTVCLKVGGVRFVFAKFGSLLYFHLSVHT